MSMLEKNKQYIVTIEGYSSEAFGIARVEGRAVFIPGTIQGEVWEVRILKITNTAIYGKGIKCIKASPLTLKILIVICPKINPIIPKAITGKTKEFNSSLK